MFKPKRLIILILIVGFLFSCGPPSATDRDGEVIQSIMSIFDLCEYFKTKTNDTECTFIKLESYGILEIAGIALNPDVIIQIAIIDHKFFATGSHIQSGKVITIDSSGNIVPIS